MLTSSVFSHPGPFKFLWLGFPVKQLCSSEKSWHFPSAPVLFFPPFFPFPLHPPQGMTQTLPPALYSSGYKPNMQAPWQRHVPDILCCHPLTPTGRHAVVTPSPIPSVKGGDALLSPGSRSQTDRRGCQLGLGDTNQVMSNKFHTGPCRDVGARVGAGGSPWIHAPGV